MSVMFESTLFLLFYKILICVVAGAGAGFATGFSGISAAIVISPMLVSFLNFDAYDAVGIALVSDVLAAAASALNYKRSGHLKIRNSLILLATVLVFTFVGSWISQYVPSPTLGSISVIWSLLMGLKFLILPDVSIKRLQGEQSKKEILIEMVSAGSVIGFISGFAGAGGGMMTLFALTTFMNYDIKDAVGTSVFIMTFTALVGGVSHISIGGFPDPVALIVCIVTTLLAATISSKKATLVKSSRLNIITGIFLTALGAVMAVVHFFF